MTGVSLTRISTVELCRPFCLPFYVYPPLTHPAICNKRGRNRQRPPTSKAQGPCDLQLSLQAATSITSNRGKLCEKAGFSFRDCPVQPLLHLSKSAQRSSIGCITASVEVAAPPRSLPLLILMTTHATRIRTTTRALGRQRATRLRLLARDSTDRGPVTPYGLGGCGVRRLRLCPHDHKPQHDRYLSEDSGKDDARDQIRMLRQQQAREAIGHIREAVDD
jgi:hypothetical protein